MAVTKRHVARMFSKGWSIANLAREYGVTVDWIESAIRKYWRRA